MAVKQWGLLACFVIPPEHRWVKMKGCCCQQRTVQSWFYINDNMVKRKVNSWRISWCFFCQFSKMLQMNSLYLKKKKRGGGSYCQNAYCVNQLTFKSQDAKVCYGLVCCGDLMEAAEPLATLTIHQPASHRGSVFFCLFLFKTRATVKWAKYD